MINGLEGIPGSGKSYEAVVYHVLEAVKRGRLVVTNLPLVVEMFEAMDPSYGRLLEVRRRPRPIRGTWDAARMDDNGNGRAFELWPDGRTEAPAESVTVFGHVWDFWHDWKHPETGQGPLFVIDECHVALPKMGCSVPVIQWFKLHRHFNADVLLMTQSFRDMDQSIARLIAMLVRCRKADFLGKSDSYVRKVFAGYRGAEVSRETRKYRPEFFRLYKSHTQGVSASEAGASDVAPFVVRWRRFVLAWWVLGAVGVGTWLAWPQDRAKPKQAAKPAPTVAAAPAAASVAPAAAVASAPVVDQPAVQDKDPEPLGDKGIHLKGMAQLGARTLYVFTISQNGQPVQTFTDGELLAAGYEFRPTGPCSGFVQWRDRVRAVSCDLPAVNLVQTVSQ